MLKEEEPFQCVSCGKPFGVKSSIERVAAKLEGKHWMFQNSAKRLDVIKMCADCRVIAMTEQDFDPYGAPAGPRRAPPTIICANEIASPKAEGYSSRTARKSSQCIAVIRRADTLRASWCRACIRPAQPQTSSTVSGDHMMSRLLSASEKL